MNKSEKVKPLIIVTLLAALSIFLFEGITLVKQQRWPELTAGGILIAIALLTAFGKKYGYPTLIELLMQWLTPLGKLFLKTL